MRPLPTPVSKLKAKTRIGLSKNIPLYGSTVRDREHNRARLPRFPLENAEKIPDSHNSFCAIVTQSAQKHLRRRVARSAVVRSTLGVSDTRATRDARSGSSPRGSDTGVTATPRHLREARPLTFFTLHIGAGLNGGRG